MHLYLRILLDAAATYSEAEETALRECLRTTPGIDEVRRIERHPRGGYTVFVERTGELAPALDHLSARGYRAVM